MDIVLVGHIVASLVVAAANVAALTTTVIARRSRSPARILRLLRLHEVFAARTLVPAAVTVLLTGAWLTHRTGASLAAPWLAGTIALFVISALVGVLFLLPEERRAIREAERLVMAGERRVSHVLVRHTAAPAIVVAEWGAQLLMVAMFWLMIAQPA